MKPVIGALGSGRAVVGLLSLAAVVVPAAGIAYLGASSYQSDRGLVAARLEQHHRAAAGVAERMKAELVRALEGVSALFARADGAPPDPVALAALRSEGPLAEHPFRVGADGRLRYAARDPLRPAAADDDDTLLDEAFLARAPRTCPERGFAACVRSIRDARKRERQLAEARRLELDVCVGAIPGACEPRARPLAEARRAYAALVGFDDTGPGALLGLARVDRLAGSPAGAAARYRELRDRFGDRLDAEGIDYALLADLGEVEQASSAAVRALRRLEIYRAVAANRYRAPPAALLAIADRVRSGLAEHALEPGVAAEVEALDARLTEARAYARFAAELAVESENLLRTAVEQPRGRPALHAPGRTVVYRREPDGSVVGLMVEPGTLDRVAAGAPVPIEQPAPTTRALVSRVGATPPDGMRTLASAGFGALLPHLTLAIVNDRSQPDPLDAIIRARGRRHLLLTGGLLALLAIGLLATIRSTARERELARLKSDFVSTVSHELKTPLTSIRMFAEMLQDGVAGGDRGREARYHSIIVRESERLGLLIANVLDFSHVERGTRNYQLHPESPAEVAQEAVETFRRLREGEGYEVRFSIDQALGEVRVAIDRAVVVQSLLNLLSNAAKYGGAQTPIEVLVAPRGAGWVGIAVRDSGPGIPRAEQARIFREFYRAPAAYSSGVEGTGLGLALVRRHLDEMGGRVELDSTLGRGSTFTLVVPEVSA